LLPDIPIIAFVHGTALRQLELCPHLAGKAIEGCRKVDIILALNLFQKQQIQRKFKIPENRIEITGTGYNSDIFFPQDNRNNNEDLKLVYCGKLSAAKGVIHLIKAFNDISRAMNNTQLIIVGSSSGKEAREIYDLADSNSNITFTGAVKQNRLGSIFRECDIFILPSFYEGVPLVILEALASGLMVVTTKLPGLKEWVGNIICKAGVIEYFPLPRLINTDQIKQEDISGFETDLKQAIINTISLIQKQDQPSFPFEEIEERSWRNLFDKIMKLTRKLT